MRKDLMLENRHLPGINPRVCGTQSCAPRHSFGPAVRDYTLLHYVHTGKGVLCKARGKYLVEPGHIFVIQAGETSVYTADAKEPWAYSWVGFENRLSAEEKIENDLIFAPAAGGLFTEMTDCGMGSELYICGKIYELLHLLTYPAPSLPEAGLYVRLALDYIEANYMQKITVRQIANSLGLERSYFSRLFSRVKGQSPQQYILHYRLAKACTFLRQEQLPVARLAGPGWLCRRRQL